MAKLVLDESKVRVQGVNWYRGNVFAGAELVTSAPSNKDLDIESINLFPRSDKGAYASANIRFTNGVTIRGTIWYTKDMKHLRLGFYQTQSTKDNQWYPQEVMNFPLPMQAQVLRYAESVGKHEEVPVTETFVPEATQAVQETVVNTPAVEAVNAVAEADATPDKKVFNPEDMANMTQEELLALING